MADNGFDIGSLGMNAANTVIGTGLGLLLQNHNNKVQLKQQQKLQDLQISGQKQMADYNEQKQLDLWNKTNYPAQVEQLNKAGLNPALLYGAGGGGGTTTGSGYNESVNAPTAQQNTGEVQAEQGMALQNAMLSAQIENIKADTKLKETDATKHGGADTELEKSQTKLNIANTGNVEVDTKLKSIQAEIAQVEYNFQNVSLNDRLDIIKQDARKITGEATQALVQGNIATNTREATENTIKAYYITEVIKQGLLTQQTKQSAAQTGEAQQHAATMATQAKVNIQQVQNMVQGLMIDWDKLSNDNQRIQIERELQQFYTDPTNLLLTQVGGVVKEILNMKLGTKVNPIGFRK